MSLVLPTFPSNGEIISYQKKLLSLNTRLSITLQLLKNVLLQSTSLRFYTLSGKPAAQQQGLWRWQHPFVDDRISYRDETSQSSSEKKEDRHQRYSAYGFSGLGRCAVSNDSWGTLLLQEHHVSAETVILLWLVLESFANPVLDSRESLSETSGCLSDAQTPGHLHWRSKWGKHVSRSVMMPTQQLNCQSMQATSRSMHFSILKTNSSNTFFNVLFQTDQQSPLFR